MKIALKAKKISANALIQMRQDLMADSQLTRNYIILVITACLIASFGLLSNSAAVIIGAMLVAPLMLPLRGLAFGVLESDAELSRCSFISISMATLVSILLSMLLGKFTGIQDFGTEVLARTQPTLIDLGIAIFAGGLSGFSKVEQAVSDAVAGTAIAVALMPPLCVIGLTLSQGFFELSYGATLLYVTNLIGIAVACMLVFIAEGYSRVKKELGFAIFLTVILTLPLNVSFLKLLTQAKVKTDLKRLFEKETLTGQRVDLQQTMINWKTEPPEVYLKVRAIEPITPKQVRLVQEFVTKRMQRPFTLIFLVENIAEVRGEEEKGRRGQEDRGTGGQGDKGTRGQFFSSDSSS